jgi:hypothetical protein
LPRRDSGRDVSPPSSRNASPPASGSRGVITFSTHDALSVPRLAYASRSWLHNVGSANKTPSTPRQPRAHTSGGRQPPWYELRACEREVRNPSNCNCRRGLQTHGGLTPAALVNVRLCIAKRDFPRTNDRAAIKSGGRKPPVARIGSRLQCTPNPVRRTTTGESRAGGVSPPWLANASATGS